MNQQWWEEQAGFFGEYYIYGDNSLEGHLSSNLSVDERTRLEVEGIVKLLDLKTKMKIFDIPCGYGRHSIALAIKGHEVFGSDINTTHLSSAKKEASKKNVMNVRFFKEDMLSISYLDEFDVLLNLFFSFGFFTSDLDNLNVLKKFYSALKKNGKFLMHTDVNIPRIRSGKYKFNETRTLNGGGKLIISESFNEKNKRINGTWTIKSEKNIITKPYSVRVYEKDEFIDMCINVGFLSCEAYGNWHGDAYDEEKEEIIFIATK